MRLIFKCYTYLQSSNSNYQVSTCLNINFTQMIFEGYKTILRILFFFVSIQEIKPFVTLRREKVISTQEILDLGRSYTERAESDF